MPSPIERFKSAYNAFMGRAPTNSRVYYGSSGSRPDRTRRRIQNERSVINSIYNRITVDGSSIDIKHARLDKDGNYEETIKSSLNRVLSIDANVDQTGRALMSDLIYSMLDEGCVALFPTHLTTDPTYTDSYEVLEARVGKIVEWYPKHVRIEVYNEDTGRKEQLVVEKRYVPIIENPFYSIMNEPNSTLQRLIRVLNQLDRVNEEISAGKMDLIVQLPFLTKSPAKQKLAEERRKSIEAQLTGSQYGVAYIDGTEKVIQLNRPVENTLWNQATELKQDLFNQMGLTMEILNGTADEKTMQNYYSRIIEPILTAIIEEVERKWLSKTAQSQNQGIRFFRDPFKLVPVTSLADLGDTFIRNKIMTSNEMRTKAIGLPPVKDDPQADKLVNPNLNQPDESLNKDSSKGGIDSTEKESGSEIKHSNELYHYGIPRRSGRYPWGSGERPYQGDGIHKEKKDDETTYSIKNPDGTVQSELKVYDFNLKNFNWNLMADVVTQDAYRRKGLATKLINKAYDDVKKADNGLYLFVKKNNENAIKLYEKLNFDNIKTYSLKDGDYYIMAKGNSDIQQLKKMNFS